MYKWIWLTLQYIYIYKNGPQKVEKITLKSCSEILFFSLLVPWAAQTAQTEEFMFQNVTYRPTVHKTGVLLTNNFVKEIEIGW